MCAVYSSGVTSRVLTSIGEFGPVEDQNDEGRWHSRVHCWLENRRRLAKFQGQLHGQGAPWKKAFEEYFVVRLSLRYLNPIKLLQEHGTFQGEGFSIVAIQCTLIEFLAAARAGKGYRLPKRGEPALGEFEYSKSAEMFIAFLSQIEPFLEPLRPTWLKISIHRSAAVCFTRPEPRTDGLSGREVKGS